jgi:hypothetical protein
MKNLGFGLCLVYVLVSCSKDAEINIETTLNGRYSGSFSRNNVNSGVHIQISNGRLNGSSDRPYFPAIGELSYTTANDKISFNNENFWPAHFDWSLILNGSWQFEQINDLLIFRQTNGDVYKLKREPL